MSTNRRKKKPSSRGITRALERHPWLWAVQPVWNVKRDRIETLRSPEPILRILRWRAKTESDLEGYNVAACCRNPCGELKAKTVPLPHHLTPDTWLDRPRYWCDGTRVLAVAVTTKHTSLTRVFTFPRPINAENVWT